METANDSPQPREEVYSKLTTMRNPILPLRPPGDRLLRRAERQLRGAWSQLPLRKTRYIPETGPCGSVPRAP